MSSSVHSHTPSVVAVDSRGLTLRDIAYHRHPGTPGLTDSRITRYDHNYGGFTVLEADPRLHGAGLTNFTYVRSLGGKALRVHSADTGIVLSLEDAAGRPAVAISHIQQTETGRLDLSQAVNSTWQYEDCALPGRPVSVTQQVGAALPQVSERFVYAGNADAEKAMNLAGKVFMRYDGAGLECTDAFSLAGPASSVTRWLVKEGDDPNTVSNWFGNSVQAWSQLLTDVGYTTKRAIDPTGGTLATTDACGNVQCVEYDVAGLVTRSSLVWQDLAPQVILEEVEYGATGQKQRERHGNGVVVHYDYEQDTERLSRIRTVRPAGHAAGARTLQDLRYTYDRVGNVVSVSNEAQETRYWRNQKVQPLNTYTYDSLYQLVNASGREMATGRQPAARGRMPTAMALPDTSTYTLYSRSYSYDTAGNMTQIRHSSPANDNNHTTAITISDTSNRGAVSTLAADPSDVEALFGTGGQQLQLRPAQALTWTPSGELARVTPATTKQDSRDHESYLYGHDRQRVTKTSLISHTDGTHRRRVVYLPGLEQRSSAIDEQVTEHLQVITMEVAGRTSVRGLYWASGLPEGLSNHVLRYTYDNLIGSSGLEVDGGGMVIGDEEYYPYGGTALWTARSQTEARYKSVRYSGKERDATGLYYYGHRYYQPWAGRWLSADPVGTVDGLNLYRMVKNNPVTLRDNDGRVATEANEVAGGITLADTFKPGDIVYGLDAPRKKAVSTLIAAGFKQKEPIKPPTKNLLAVLRQSLRKPSIKSNILIQNDITNAVWDATDPLKYADDRTIGKQLNDAGRAIQFKSFLAVHPKYNVKDQEDARLLQSQPFNAMKLGVPLWKKTSKAGLEFQLLVRQQPLHFVADVIGDDIGAVVSKQGHGASITSSELRWLYRHRNLPEVRANLFFYKDGNRVSHDSIFGNANWANYRPKKTYSGSGGHASRHLGSTVGHR